MGLNRDRRANDEIKQPQARRLAMFLAVVACRPGGLVITSDEIDAFPVAGRLEAITGQDGATRIVWHVAGDG